MISALYKSPSCYGWWLKTSCKRRYFVFSLSRDLMCLRAKRITWLYGGVSLVISEYHTNFDDHRPFERGDIKLPIFHATSRKRVVRGSCNNLSSPCHKLLPS